MGAAAIRAGVDADRATRLTAALATVAFLVYFHLRLRRRFGEATADYATAILATAGGWAAFAQAGVFDAPLTAAVGAALLALLEWVEDPARKERLPLFGALLGVAMLAKGLAGPAVAAMALLAVCRERGVLPVARDLFHWRTTGPFVAVAAPWYLLCYAANGRAFLDEFFWRHHVERMVGDGLQHLQPWWFYLPVVAGALLPWTPLLASLRRRDVADSPSARFLLAWALGTLVFFSISRNKLPGYILPALPAVAALAGRRLARDPAPRWALPACALLLGALPLAARLLPVGLADGFGAAWPPSNVPWIGLALALAAAGVAAMLARRGRAGWAAALVAALAVGGIAHLKRAVYPALDEAAGARSVWRRVEPRLTEACIGEVRRHIAYGLAFYSRGEIPRCADAPRPLRIEGDPPRLGAEEPR
jgi:4-amino-4-deoxy-L-arabinose transferase-like glycosyltransferase